MPVAAAVAYGAARPTTAGTGTSRAATPGLGWLHGRRRASLSLAGLVQSAPALPSVARPGLPLLILVSPLPIPRDLTAAGPRTPGPDPWTTPPSSAPSMTGGAPPARMGRVMAAGPAKPTSYLAQSRGPRRLASGVWAASPVWSSDGTPRPARSRAGPHTTAWPGVTVPVVSWSRDDLRRMAGGCETGSAQVRIRGDSRMTSPVQATVPAAAGSSASRRTGGRRARDSGLARRLVGPRVTACPGAAVRGASLTRGGRPVTATRRQIAIPRAVQRRSDPGNTAWTRWLRAGSATGSGWTGRRLSRARTRGSLRAWSGTGSAKSGRGCGLSGRRLSGASMTGLRRAWSGTGSAKSGRGCALSGRRLSGASMTGLRRAWSGTGSARSGRGCALSGRLLSGASMTGLRRACSGTGSAKSGRGCARNGRRLSEASMTGLRRACSGTGSASGGRILSGAWTTGLLRVWSATGCVRNGQRIERRVDDRPAAGLERDGFRLERPDLERRVDDRLAAGLERDGLRPERPALERRVDDRPAAGLERDGFRPGRSPLDVGPDAYRDDGRGTASDRHGFRLERSTGDPARAGWDLDRSDGSAVSRGHVLDPLDRPRDDNRTRRSGVGPERGDDPADSKAAGRGRAGAPGEGIGPVPDTGGPGGQASSVSDSREDDTLTRPLPVILPGATALPRPEPVAAPRGPFEPARPSQPATAGQHHRVGRAATSDVLRPARPAGAPDAGSGGCQTRSDQGPLPDR